MLGNEGGIALAELLAGKFNPSGRLPFTYPRFVNDLVLYDHKGTEIKDKYFGNNGFNPQWEFASGLSYSDCEYENLKIEDTGNGNYRISIDIIHHNQSGKLVVPLFINDKVASITPSLKKLRKFKKITFDREKDRGISKKTVVFNIKREELGFIGVDNKWIVEPGEFEVMIGDKKTLFELK